MNEKKISNLGKVKRALSKFVSPRGKEKKDRTAAKIADQKTKANSTVENFKNSSGSESEKVASPRTPRTRAPAHSSIESPKNSSTRVKRAKSGFSPRVQLQDEWPSPQDQQREMGNIFKSLGRNNKNLTHDDLMRVFFLDLESRVR